MTRFSLRAVRLRPGAEYRDEVEIELEPFEFGGQPYLPVPQTIPAELSITRASSGTVFGLAFRARVHGPCYRCLVEAVVDVPINGREYQAARPGDDEELKTPYVSDDMLDLTAWARDAIALALPEQILCRPDCAGLCPVCGVNLNVEPHEHDEERADPRWAALAELRDRL
jgi:DUF177 domain-containing protein